MRGDQIGEDDNTSGMISDMSIAADSSTPTLPVQKKTPEKKHSKLSLVHRKKSSEDSCTEVENFEKSKFNEKEIFRKNPLANRRYS